MSSSDNFKSNPEKITCSNCDKQIDSSKYFLHQRMCFINTNKCSYCNKPFTIDDLEEHINSFHVKIKCELCNLDFPKTEIENHKTFCENKLISCKYCELNILSKDYDEHLKQCGAITKLCTKCDQYISKKDFSNHFCQNIPNDYLNENIKIENSKEDKKEKKLIKKEYKKNTKKNNKKNKFVDITNIKINCDNNYDVNEEVINNEGDGKEKINETEVSNSIIKKNKIKKNENKQENNKKKKNKNNHKKENNLFKNVHNFKGGVFNDFNDDGLDDYDNYIPKKNLNLHNIKCGIPEKNYQNYNNINENNFFYDEQYFYEDEILKETLKLSLKEK